MEKLDQEMQKRVWQRVQQGMPGKELPSRGNLKAWLLLARENTASYRQLARQISGNPKERLRRLEQQSRQWTECARGLCRLRGEDVKSVPAKPPQEPPRRMLEKCWNRELRLWREARSLDCDPEYGPVYSRMADQAMERCMGLLELLGMLE